MANPTTNFGWVMPTSTSLVTNLPADFNTFGQGVDTSMAQLKGGTTGQILSKTSATDMAFTWITPNPGDITAVTAGTGISGGGTSGDVTITNSMATEITAKGDLIVGTGSATFDNLAAGANGTIIVADSSTTTGLRYQGSQAAGKNTIINGGMDIWQRGTSFPFIAGELFTADRWFVYRGGNVLGATLSRQTSGVNFTQYCSRMQRDSGNTSVQPLYANYTMETQDSIGYAGQTIVFSFYARAGANYSGGALSGRVLYGTGTNQRVTAFTGIAVTASVSATLTTSWQRFQATATVSASATEIGFDFGYTPTGTASTNDYVEFTGVQFELGSVATTFQRAGGTLQGETSACQRYYYRTTGQAAAANDLTTGFCNSTTSAVGVVRPPVTMRIAPTCAFGAAGDFVFVWSAGASTITAAQIDRSSVDSINLRLTTSGLTTGQGGYMALNTGTTKYLEMSAEL